MKRPMILTAVATLLVLLLSAPTEAITTSWIRLVGTGTVDRSSAVDSYGGTVFVAGSTRASLAGQPFAGGEDVYLRLFNAAGTVGTTQEFGSAGDEYIYGLDAGEEGVFLAGFTTGALDHASLGSRDAVVRKYSTTGTFNWSDQFGTSAYDQANDVVIMNGAVYVVGYTDGTMGAASKGGGDAFIRRYSKAGDVIWTKQFGTSTYDVANAIATRNGVLYVAGQTDGTLGSSSFGDTDGFIRAFDAAGKAQWTKQFGTDQADYVEDADAGAHGPFAVGATFGDFGGTNLGNYDAFVFAADKDGKKRWIASARTSVIDYGWAVTAVPGGGALFGGETAGTLPGESNAGLSDAFLREVDDSGATLDTIELGTAGNDYLYGLGNNRVGVGMVAGSVGGQGFAGGGYDGLVWQTT